MPLRAACSMLLLIVLVLPASAQTGSLDIRLLQRDGAPVAIGGVTVVLQRDTTIVRQESTGGDGVVRLTGLSPGPWRVTAERLGFHTEHRDVNVIAGVLVRVEIVMRERVLGLPGVIVEAERRRSRFEETAGLTAAELTQRDVKLLPGVGEADVLRAIEVLPGVVSTSDFSSAFNVRGGSADQNLILLDGFPIYNPFHLGGLFSVFNADMVARAELLAGGFPARYGGRVASVLAVESDAGVSGLDVHTGLSVLATRAAVGFDLPAGLLDATGLTSGRMRVSARRSYFDQLLRPFFDFPYHLTDLQLFGEAWTAGGGRLTLTGYTGRDVLDLTGTNSFPLRVRWDWGNSMVGAGWTAPLGRGRELALRLGHTRFSTGIGFPEFGDTDIRSRIDQSLLRADVALPAGAWQFELGAAADRLSYDNLARSAGTVFGGGNARGWLLGSYLHAAWRPPQWVLEAGMRADSWLPSGEDARSVLQPRVAAKRFLSRDVAVRVAVGRYAQFLHSLRDEELPLGIDVWVLSGERAPVVISDQAQVGLEGFAGAWFGSIETYWRWFDGVATNNFAEDPNDPLDDLVGGRGQSYGVDLQLRRERGRVRPMLAVSWLRAWREFPNHATGEDPVPIERYPPVFDRRLDADLVVQAMLPRAWELGVRWNLGTGLPYTRPVGGYVFYDYSSIDGRWRPPVFGSDTSSTAVALGPRNRERYPLYHRLDIGVRRTFVKRWGTLSPYLDVLNVYNRRNVLFYFYEYDEIPSTRSGLSMFPVLPTIGVEARF